MAMSEAHKKASAKYDAKAYEKKLVRFKPDQWEKFKAYTAENGYTDNGYIISAIMYCIENNIDLKQEKKE
ncbi:MAG: hypothetical protein NC485_12250 [Ruminococcus flavefaciens]|nr:hypothetical protein [Ruminococcus flavefaciens]